MNDNIRTRGRVADANRIHFDDSTLGGSEWTMLERVRAGLGLEQLERAA